ncbi:hypothetical protein BpHYR1_032430 [Brachionus plicatilis]|uniref:Uncharacterized protein n=1 Tax=Brachionus plicatilis TaxID=10195 RepID=A0A3M7T2A1_BRAPC|nr:hypothetical protein BpHYR1_032430 [Brachionus plicatilis]
MKIDYFPSVHLVSAIETNLRRQLNYALKMQCASQMRLRHLLELHPLIVEPGQRQCDQNL